MNEENLLEMAKEYNHVFEKLVSAPDDISLSLQHVFMKTIDEIDKIKAVVLYILNRCGGTQDFVSLAKKMYLAQRKYLALYGRPIFNDKFYARDSGPVPAFTYKALYVEALKDTSSPEIVEFNKSFSVSVKENSRSISSSCLPDMDELAVEEVEVLDMIMKESEGMSHKDGAWMIARERMKADPMDGRMSFVSIARAGGANKAVLEYLRDSLNFECWCKV